MVKHTYRCPFGATLIRADNAKSLRQKITDHNVMAHGVRPLIVCGARAVTGGGQTPAASQHMVYGGGRSFRTVSDRGI